MDKTFHCFYCGLEDKKVEAQGIYHCPNALCSGPGAHWFRCKLKSYKELGGGKSTVCEKELRRKGRWYMFKQRIKKIFKG